MTAFYFMFGSASLILLYLPFYYDRYVVKPYVGMPEPVTKELRKVYHFENIQPDAKQALKFYKKALLAVVETGMDPFSDETIGIKLRYAGFFEKHFHYVQAIEVLQTLRSECVKWVQLFGDEHHEDGRRTRILAWAVRMSAKMGELYGLPWVEEPDKAEEAFSWAVETVLREQRRREVEGQKPGEGEWIAGEEFGGTMERLAHYYQEKEQHAYAAPLFLQALSVCPTNTCHAALLMNNLATSLSQQPKPSPATLQLEPTPGRSIDKSRSGPGLMALQKLNPFSSSGPTPSEPEASRSSLPANIDPMTQVVQWANMSISTVERVPAENRNDECDQAKCAALYNLGELAEQRKDMDEATLQYQRARQVANSVGWGEGVEMANQGIKRTQKALAN